jgi:hypothetical protein
MAHVPALPVWQGLLGPAAGALMFEEEDRDRAQEAEIARGGAVADLAVVFALGVIAPVMLLGFDRPIAGCIADIPVGRGFRPEAKLSGQGSGPASWKAGVPSTRGRRVG